MRIKKNNYYCFILILIIFIIGCSTAENDWEKAVKENTIDSYQAFIKKHPDHKYSIIGKEKITEFTNWEKALRENTIDSYQAFIKKYPNHKYSAIGLPISTEKPLEVQSISASVNKGEISLEQGKKPSSLIIRTIGKIIIKVNDEKMCIPCVSTIHLTPSIKVPLSIFYDLNTNSPDQPKYIASTGTVKQNIAIKIDRHTGLRIPGGIDNIEIDNANINVPENIDTTSFIVSGPAGATLKKINKSFMLIKGEAYFK